jgi:malate synthase
MNEHTAVLMARPRGLHLDERHVTVDGQVTSGLMVDAAGYLAHNAAVQLASKHTPALYIPKLERMEEAALVDDILCAIEDGVGVARHSTKVSTLCATASWASTAVAGTTSSPPSSGSRRTRPSSRQTARP